MCLCLANSLRALTPNQHKGCPTLAAHFAARVGAENLVRKCPALTAGPKSLSLRKNSKTGGSSFKGRGFTGCKKTMIHQALGRARLQSGRQAAEMYWRFSAWGELFYLNDFLATSEGVPRSNRTVTHRLLMIHPSFGRARLQSGR